MKEGDENSKFFHNFARGRKASNTILHLESPGGFKASNFKDLSRMGIEHFRSLFKDP